MFNVNNTSKLGMFKISHLFKLFDIESNSFYSKSFQIKQFVFEEG